MHEPVQDGGDARPAPAPLGGDQDLIIDVSEDDLAIAQREQSTLLRHLEATVLPVRKARAQKEAEANEKALMKRSTARVNRHHARFLDSWWQLSYRRQDLLEAIGQLGRYVGITRVSSWDRGPVFTFVAGDVHLGDGCVAFSFEDDYSFGVLQSSVHEQWFRGRCSTLKSDLRYTSKSVFDTFPWPQSPSENQAGAVAEAAAAIIDFRASQMKAGLNLASQYDVLRQPGRTKLRRLHDDLNAAVCTAYGFPINHDAGDTLALGREVASKIANENPVTGPGPQGPSPIRSTWSMA